MIRIFATLSLVFFAARAEADSDTIYPGSMCQGQGSTERTNGTYGYGTLRNTGSSAYTFDCPILNLVPTDTDLEVTVNVLDLTTTGKVSCTVYARSLTAGTSSYLDYDSDSTVTADVHTSGESLSMTGITSTSRLLHMTCSVPAKSSTSYSSVVSYQVTSS